MIDFSTEMNGMVVGLKGNCSALLSYAEAAFESADSLESEEEEDARGIKRITTVLTTEPDKMGENWQQVSQIVRVKRTGIRYKGKKKSKKKSKKKKKKQETAAPAVTPLPVPSTQTGVPRSKNAVYFEQTSYYAVVKRQIDNKTAATVIKQHWGIEGMHRAKDVQYNEDNNKIKNKKLAPNLSQIFNFTLNIFTLTGQKSITKATEDLANRFEDLFILIANTNKYLPIFSQK
jgi:predicted transposase YbfD/YdcC